MSNIILSQDGSAILDPEVSEKIAGFEKAIKQMKAREDELKAAIMAEMQERNIIKLDTEELTITYVAPTDRETFDSRSFRKDHPDLYDYYVRIKPVKGSIRIRVHG